MELDMIQQMILSAELRLAIGILAPELLDLDMRQWVSVKFATRGEYLVAAIVATFVASDYFRLSIMLPFVVLSLKPDTAEF